MAQQSLRSVVDDADAARFVGRAEALRAARDLFNDQTPSRVLYVHGPGGIGKSALLRAVRRLATSAGFVAVDLTPRHGSPALDLRATTLTPTDGPALVLIDDAHLLGAELPAWRDRLIDVLPSSARVVFASRQMPDTSWRADGLDSIVVDVTLPPLHQAEASELLARHGVPEASRDGLIEWALGSPLALTVAALTPGGAGGRALPGELEARLSAWLGGRELQAVSPEVLEVAAIAPLVDARILAAALPSRPTRNAMAELLALPVVERVGDRAALHGVLAAVVRGRLQRIAPERYRELMVKIVEHLGSRARLGDIDALIEMSQLLVDPVMRAALGNHASAELYTDVPAPGEFEPFVDSHRRAGGSDADELARWDAEVGRYRLVVRRTDGSIVLYGSFARADLVPHEGVIAASLAKAAEDSGVDQSRSFAGVVSFSDESADVRAEAVRLATGALMHLHRVPDMQAVLIHFPLPERRPVDGLSVLARPAGMPSSRAVTIIDLRPDGAVGFVESLVLGNLGQPPRVATHEALLATDDDPDRVAMLRERLDCVFGASPRDRLLRQAIELVHFGERHTEDECLAGLNVSRRTWFRLLREARERVVG